MHREPINASAGAGLKRGIPRPSCGKMRHPKMMENYAENREKKGNKTRLAESDGLVKGTRFYCFTIWDCRQKSPHVHEPRDSVRALADALVSLGCGRWTASRASQATLSTACSGRLEMV